MAHARSVMIGLSCVTLIGGAAEAAGEAPAAEMDVATAARIFAGVEACAAEKKATFGIAIVDAGGYPLAFRRMDGGSAGISVFALEKAKAAAIWGFPTAGMAEGAAGTPGFAHAPHVVTVAGGVPAYSGGRRIGGVGVSGAAPEIDAACAAAGVTSAGLDLSRGG